MAPAVADRRYNSYFPAFLIYLSDPNFQGDAGNNSSCQLNSNLRRHRLGIVDAAVVDG